MDTEEKREVRKKGWFWSFFPCFTLLLWLAFFCSPFNIAATFFWALVHGTVWDPIWKRCRRIQKAFLVMMNQMTSCILNIILYHIWSPLGRIHNHIAYKMILIHNYLILILFTILNYDNCSIHFCTQTLQAEIPA